jgi:hypothetical protein
VLHSRPALAVGSVSCFMFFHFIYVHFVKFGTSTFYLISLLFFSYLPPKFTPPPVAIFRPQHMDMCWDYIEDDTYLPPPDVQLPSGVSPIRVAKCDPFPLDQVMLLDLAHIVPPSYFDVDFHPTIKHYINRKSNWSSLDHGSMRMKSYVTHKRAKNDPNYTGSCLPFKECPETHRLLHAIDHVLMRHGNKPPYCPSDNKSLNLHEANIPTVFLQTIVERQQMPHLDYHHKELKQFDGVNSHSTIIKPWSMDIPLSPDGFFLSMYGSYTDYVTWRNNDNSSTKDSSNKDNHFANPPICMFVPQGSVLLWRLVNLLCPCYLHCEPHHSHNQPAHH